MKRVTGSRPELPLVAVVVGTDFHPFDRLVQWVDGWLERRGREVRCVVQYGTSEAPRRADGRAQLAHDELQELVSKATVLVGHGGPGTIMEGRRAGLRPICVPRDPALGEHVDDHQQRFARHLAAQDWVSLARTREEFEAALDAALDAGTRGNDDVVDVAPRAVEESLGEIARLVSVFTGWEGPAERRLAAVPSAEDVPAVDVIIATRDRPELLRRAIGSVLAQDYPGDVCVFVVFDQADPDPSLTVDDPHRGVAVLTNRRTPGLAGARNSGVLAGSAPLVAFCDDDDHWLPGKLSAQVDALNADPGAVLASCGIQVRYGATVTPRVLSGTAIGLRDLLRARQMELHPSTFLIRRSAMVDGFGLVAEDIPGSYAEDYELLLRAARAGRVISAPVVGTEILWHQQSYFTARWTTIITALEWMLARYPEFRAVPRGRDRIRGQIAFATAALGRRRAALAEAVRVLRRSPGEVRAYLAIAVACGLISADRVMTVLQKRGRGI